MALQGTLKDFGLGDIFQLIGIQRKTGILTLSGHEDTVTVKFLEGQVVGADTKQRSVEELLGAVLVRTGRITEAQLREALHTQKQTLQRLGYVVVKCGLISEEDLIEALRVQSLQIIYRLFRWRAGEYCFRGVEDLEYDERHFIPISAETILMEGARMIDEWPIIERRIKTGRMVFRRTEAAEQLDLAVESIVDRDIEIDFGFTDAPEQPEPAAEEKRLSLSPEEREVMNLIDGKRTVEEVNDRCALGEFDTYRILADLLTRNLIEEIKKIPVPSVGGSRDRRMVDHLFKWTLDALVLVVVIAGLVGLRANSLAPWRVGPVVGTAQQLRVHASQVRLERLESAVQVFYLDAGTFPQSLDLLAVNRYVTEEDLVDPWGRVYGYRLSRGGYQLYGWDADGELRPDLTVSHRFSGLQRMLSGVASGEPDGEE